MARESRQPEGKWTGRRATLSGRDGFRVVLGVGERDEHGRVVSAISGRSASLVIEFTNGDRDTYAGVPFVVTEQRDAQGV